MSNNGVTNRGHRHDGHEQTIELAKDLLHRCRALVQELNRIQKYLADQGKENSVDLSVFQSHVSAELRSLERVSQCLSLNHLQRPEI